jgi:AmpD protein
VSIARPRSAAAAASRRGQWHEGWWSAARRIASPNFGARPHGVAVDLVLLHSISLPPGRYGGDEIERLFTNRLDWEAHPYFQAIRGLEVSSHFVIRRDGALLQFVSVDDRAWHAGRSTWRGRDNCNDYAIGIELEGLEGDRFEPAQYRALVPLLRAIRARHPLQGVAGHEHVAPGRKLDPGPGFDWAGLARRLRWSPRRFPEGVLGLHGTGPGASRREA